MKPVTFDEQPLPPPTAPEGADQASEDPPKPPEPPANVLALRERWKPLAEVGGIFDQVPPKRRWLLERPGELHAGDRQVEGVLPLGKAGMLAAAGGVGKTMALCQLAISVATGQPWFGHFYARNPGRVLLALGEEDHEEIHRRLYNVAKGLNLSAEDRALAAKRIIALPLAGVPVALVDKSMSGNVEPTDFLRELRTLLEKKTEGVEDDPWRLIVLDPLSRFAGLDTETDNAAATRFVQEIETLLAIVDRPTVLVAHHTTKDARGANGPDVDAMIATGEVDPRLALGARGASALPDGFRWAAALVPAGPTAAAFAVTKSNYSKPGPVVPLRKIDEGVMRVMKKEERDSHISDRATPELGGDVTERVSEVLEKSPGRSYGTQELLVHLSAKSTPANKAKLNDAIEALTKSGRAKWVSGKVQSVRSNDFNG